MDHTNQNIHSPKARYSGKFLYATNFRQKQKFEGLSGSLLCTLLLPIYNKKFGLKIVSYYIPEKNSKSY